MWHATVDIFGEMTPQPEIQLRPVPWTIREKLTEQATDLRVVALPEGQSLPYPALNKWRFAVSLIKYAVVGLRHFERADGTPLDANSADIDYLLAELPKEFGLWLQKRVAEITEQADAAQAIQREADAKN